VDYSLLGRYPGNQDIPFCASSGKAELLS